MMAGLQGTVSDPSVVPQDQKLALNAVMFDYWDGLPAPNLTFYADQVLPWTVIGPANAHLFARRLANQPRREVTIGTPIDQGLRDARASQVGDGVAARYRSVMVIADGWNLGEWNDESGALRAARDNVLANPDPNDPDAEVDQINGVAVRGDEFAQDPPLPNHPFDRVYFVDFMIGSDAAVMGQPFGLGLALETDAPANQMLQFADPTYVPRLRQMLKRLTRCQGDFDRDGDVDQNDLDAFNPFNPTADWNFDGVINAADATTFLSAWNLGCCP